MSRSGQQFHRNNRRQGKRSICIFRERLKTARSVLSIILLLILAHPPHVRAADGMPVCPLAPQSRLRPEMAAVVAPGIDQLNLRALPALTVGIERQLYAGTALQIIGGPVCNDAIIWWRVETEGGARGWVAEATWRSFLILPASARIVSTPFEWSCPPHVPRICPLP